MTWDGARRTIGCAVLLLLAGTAGLLRLQNGAAAQDDTPLADLLQRIKTLQGVAAEAGPVEAARAANDRAYLQYLHEREVLLARGFLGKWIAIADGQLLPVVEGKLVPADSIDALHFLIELDHGKAPHRYVFRIGEEGDAAYRFFAPNLPWSDALGTGLFRIALDTAEPKVTFAPDSVQVTRGGKRHSWPFGEKGLQLELADPSGSVKVAAIVTPSSACDGTFVLSAETAAKLGLERFEIPGTCWYGPDEHPDQRFACRRARLRWRVPELEIDVQVTVAIWPRR